MMKTWHPACLPACLTKVNVRLCIHEGSQEVLLYKKLFDIDEMAESELSQSQEIDLLRQRLMTMQTNPACFTLDIALAQQRITQLEE